MAVWMSLVSFPLHRPETTSVFIFAQKPPRGRGTFQFISAHRLRIILDHRGVKERGPKQETEKMMTHRHSSGCESAIYVSARINWTRQQLKCYSVCKVERVTLCHSQWKSTTMARLRRRRLDSTSGTKSYFLFEGKDKTGAQWLAEQRPLMLPACHGRFYLHCRTRGNLFIHAAAHLKSQLFFLTVICRRNISSNKPGGASRLKSKLRGYICSLSVGSGE